MSKELIPVVRHSTRRWDWCIPEDEKKEVESLFIDGKFAQFLNGEFFIKYKKVVVKVHLDNIYFEGMRKFCP